MNLLKGSRTYLVGSIDYSSREGCTRWRKDITKFCHSLNIGVFDPTNKACDYGKETEDFKNKINYLKNVGAFGIASKEVKEIVRTDLTMVDLSDFIIAYLDLSVTLCGTFIELAHAAMGRKAVFLVCKQGKKKIPNFLFGLLKHELFFDSFKEMKKVIKRISKGRYKQEDLMSRLKLFNYDKVYGKK